MNIRAALRYGNIEALDRELLLAFLLKRGRTFLLAHPEYEVPETTFHCFKKLIERREQHEPLAYILGAKEFFGLPFFVNRFTLIPRPETELLVEEGIKVLLQKQKASPKKKIAVIDVGTGSGCIIISLAKNIPHYANYKFFGIDISLRALQVARKNALRHTVEKQITFLQSNCLNQTQKTLEVFDELVIVANLPYLSHKLYTNTEATVQNFEPKTALVSGKDGLDHYRHLLSQLVKLAPSQKIDFLLEISPEQEELLPSLLLSCGAKVSHTFKDLSGRSRLISGSF